MGFILFLFLFKFWHFILLSSSSSFEWALLATTIIETLSPDASQITPHTLLVVQDQEKPAFLSFLFTFSGNQTFLRHNFTVYLFVISYRSSPFIFVVNQVVRIFFFQKEKRQLTSLSAEIFAMWP